MEHRQAVSKEKRIVHQDFQGKISKDIISGITITGLILAFSIKLPIIGFFCCLFLPMPVLFYRSKLGRAHGIIIPIVTIIMMIVVLGGISIDVIFFVGLLLLGFSLSEFIEKNLSVEKIILYACGVVLSAAAIGLIFYSNILGTGIFVLVSEYVAKNLELTVKVYETMGMPEENIQMVLNSLKKIQYVLVRIMPALIIASLLVVTWINLLLARPVLDRKNLFYPNFGSLNRWKASESLVWGIIGCGLMLLLPNKSLKILALNGLIIFMPIYFFQGIAIVSFYFEKKRFPIMLKFFLYSVIVLQQLLILLVIGTGFFDIWLNFRKLGTLKTQ